MANVFCITYEGKAKDGNTYVPYRAIAHNADEAIAIINTWKPYGGKKYIENITVNPNTERKIRKAFSEGLISPSTGEPTRCLTMRTTNCGAWDICFYPALADTIEEHQRIYNEQREKAKRERMRKANEAKNHRLEELYLKRRGWYHTEITVTVMVFARKGDDYFTNLTFESDIIADNGANAFDMAMTYIEEHPEDLTHRGNMAVLHAEPEMTSQYYSFTFLGVKTDDGYSVERWYELKAEGKI